MKVNRISREQAEALAYEFIQTKPRAALDDYVILSAETQTEDFGWVFFYNTRKFAETGDWNWALGGNAPLIVDNESGKVVETGTYISTDKYIEYYKKHRTLEGFD